MSSSETTQAPFGRWSSRATRSAAQEPHAWTLWQLGKLAFAIGDVDRAAAYYEQSLAIYPDYVYALDALALAEAARGNLDRAIRLSRRTVDAIPLPQFVTQLGDLYHAAARKHSHVSSTS